MLVLSRKCGEEIVICLNGEKVTVTVVEVQGGRVRLGVCAAPHVEVHRQEVWERRTGWDGDRQARSCSTP